MISKRLTLSLLALLFTGCTPSRPIADLAHVPVQRLQTDVDSALTSNSFKDGGWLSEEWWTLFNDPQLTKCIQTALTAHPTIAMAESKIRLSKAASDAVGTPLWPLLKAKGDIMRVNASKTGLFGGADKSGAFPLSYTQTEVALSGQWEIDWWGKHRSSLNAALGQVQAAVAEEALSRLVLSVSVAQAYFYYQTSETRQALAKSLLAGEEKCGKLIQTRVEKGLDTELSLRHAESSLYGTKEQVLAAGQGVAVAKNRLNALLAGDFLQEFEVSSKAMDSFSPFPLPKQLPLNLLSHRPDVIAQLWRVEAASLGVQSAKAAFYPNLDLMGLVGFQTIYTSELFKGSSVNSSYGPALSLPLFNAGFLSASLDAKQEEFVIASQVYEEVLLRAVQEVLDGLSNYRILNERLEEVKRMTVAIREIHRLTAQRFEHDLSSSLDVIAAEREWLLAKDKELVTRTMCLDATLALVKALGGGYTYHKEERPE